MNTIRLAAVATTMALCAASTLAETISVSAGAGGSFTTQSFNGTRGVDVTVVPGPSLSVTAMSLEGLFLGGASALVGARIYDSSTMTLLASGNVTTQWGGIVTVPISITLAGGASYRVAFYVETTPANQGTSLMRNSGFPYGEPTGHLWINSAHSNPVDSFPTTASFSVPRIKLHTAEGTPSCFPGTGGVIACPCGQPPNPTGGCANFGAGSTSGAVLAAGGIPSVPIDYEFKSLFLTTTNHRAPAGGVLNVFFSYKPGTGTPTTGTVSGAGVRCIGTGGSLKRLYTVQVFDGQAVVPGPGGLPISYRSASFAGHAIVPPETRHYFNVYRDAQAAGPCGNTAVSTNLTNMISVLWTL